MFTTDGIVPHLQGLRFCNIYHCCIFARRKSLLHKRSWSIYDMEIKE